jgi:hypothetical protein
LDGRKRNKVGAARGSDPDKNAQTRIFCFIPADSFEYDAISLENEKTGDVCSNFGLLKKKRQLKKSTTRTDGVLLETARRPSPRQRQLVLTADGNSAGSCHV